jgi:hypothetical protein
MVRKVMKVTLLLLALTASAAAPSIMGHSAWAGCCDK